MMNKVSFLFFCCLYILLSVFAMAGSIDLSTQLYLSVFFIVLVGIPHGAIDHVLFLEESNIKPVYFYLAYLGLMGLYIIGWMAFAVWSLVLFLLLSAYHFGQSQFSEFNLIPKFKKIILNLSWGISILSGLIYYHFADLAHIFQSSADLAKLMVAFDPAIYSILLPVSTLLSVLILAWSLYKKQISGERFVAEIYILVLIHFCFYVFPLLIGFTLYFITLHSVKVLTEEFAYLNEKRKNFSLINFIKMLAPLTLISIFGGAIMWYCSTTGIIEVSNTLLVLILISILTLPHSIVMDSFYKRFLNGNS